MSDREHRRHEQRGGTWRDRWLGSTSQRIRALLTLGVVLGLGATTTMAAWTDTSTASSGQFTTGTLDIKVGTPAVDNDPASFETQFSMTDMAPGSSQDAVLQVRNAGSLPLTYAITGATGGAADLGAALRLSVFSSTNGGTCAGSPLVSNVPLNGQVLSEQPVLASGASKDLCFRAALPSGAPSSLQGKSSTITLTLDATNA